MNQRFPNVGHVCAQLAELAPLALAEDWDNVGLLLGSRGAVVPRVMTCLTIDAAVVDEAIDRQVGLIVTHHPLPFKPLAKITSDSLSGQLVLRLLAHPIAVYSAHTAFDSAADGINQMWAAGLGCQAITPLRAVTLAPATLPALREGRAPARGGSDRESLPEPSPEQAPTLPPSREGGVTTSPSLFRDEGSREGGVTGAGRAGDLPTPLTADELAVLAGRLVAADEVRVAGDHRAIRRVAFACGSGGSFLAAAHAAGCQAMITGEATFHQCLEAKARGIVLLLVGHYHSERFAMERLADTLQTSLTERWPDCEVFASEHESSPLRTIHPSQAPLTP